MAQRITHVQVATNEDDLAVSWHQELVRLSEIGIPGYQRGVQHSLVRDIVARYDPRKMQPLTLSRRVDGSAWVIDGRQRLTALRQKGWDDRRMLCLVYADLTEAEEAFIYTETQTTGSRRILLPADQLKGAVAWGDPEAIAIIHAIEHSGLSVDTRVPSQATNLMAVATVRRIVRRFGIHMLDEVLRLIQVIYPVSDVPATKDPNRGRLNGQILMGLASFLDRYGNGVDEGVLVRRLQHAGLEQLRERSGEYRKVVHTGRWEVAVARAIRHIYTEGRGGAPLPEWS